MKFADIPKFVINLDRRPDRLESITKEMEYIGWDFERFAAIDTNSYMGITKSTFELISTSFCKTPTVSMTIKSKPANTRKFIIFSKIY